MSWLAFHKDKISSIASIVSVIAFLFATYQVYLGRQILEAQASVAALQNARAFLVQIENNPQAAAEIYKVDSATLKKSVFINSMISLYSEQFILWDRGILNDDHWKIFKSELCSFVENPMVSTRVISNIKNNSYPEDFTEILNDC
jgi:hypothetical protein